jgi:RHH-type transcriptional regulator, proline utilization regulon repressor / proline dehydrogenase / delta 1-pyrroline-5-carboxylate dehydrogenase
VAQHVREYLIREGRELPGAMQAGLKIAGGKLTGGIAAKVMRRLVSDLAGRFIAADTPDGALKPLRQLHERGIGMTVDLLGEATVSEREAQEYMRRYEALIDTLARETAKWNANAAVDTRPRANVSIKISALSPTLSHLAPEQSSDDAVERIRALVERAKSKNVFVYLDAEQWTINEIILRTFEKLATLPEFVDYPHLGIVLQAYLKSSNHLMARLNQLAAARNAPFSVRLVKGAYWDYEVMRCRQHGYPCPVYPTKGETDAQFEALAAQLIDASPQIEPAFATHNLRSMAFALAYAEQRGLDKDAFEFQSLYGMAGEERSAQRELGCRARVYAPIGEMLPGMAYLVRRLLENTSNQGFLRLSHEADTDIDELLRRPTAGTAPARTNRAFVNAPWIEFVESKQRDRFAEAVAQASQKLPVNVAPVISGRNVRTSDMLERESPNDTGRLVAKVGLATDGGRASRG